MLTLGWLSSTTEGGRLGQLAASQVRYELTPLPWWFSPFEPWRWFFTITGEASHSFYTALIYLTLASLLGLLRWRRAGWKAGLAALATAMMFLMGGQQAIAYVITRTPHGTHWIVPPDAAFRLADLHCHTQASGAALMPEEALRWHIARGFSVVAITDSNKIYGAQRAQEDASRLNLPILVVPGEEYRGTTHLLMFNLKAPISADKVSLPEAIQQARAQGALVVAAHCWTGKNTPQELLDFGVQGFEVTNGPVKASDEVLELCRKGHLPELGDLDFRGGAHPRTATVLPLWADTAEKVQQALEKGECASLYCPAWVESTDFSRMTRLSLMLPESYQEGGTDLWFGLLFWAGIGWLSWRFLKGKTSPVLSRSQQSLALISVLAMTAITAVVAVLSVWWKFKSGWFPRVELSYAIWALACPCCLVQCWRLG